MRRALGAGAALCVGREDFLLAQGTLPLGLDPSQPHIFGKRLLAAALVSHTGAAPPSQQHCGGMMGAQLGREAGER